MEIDETLKKNIEADIRNMLPVTLKDEDMESIIRCLEITIGHHYTNPLPEQESTDLTDLTQYVTNLLYAVYTMEGSLDFDKWVEEKTNELGEYYNAIQSKSLSNVSAEEILEPCITFRDRYNVKCLKYEDAILAIKYAQSQKVMPSDEDIEKEALMFAKKHAKQSVGDFAVGFNWGAKYIKNKTI